MGVAGRPGFEVGDGLGVMIGVANSSSGAFSDVASDVEDVKRVGKINLAKMKGVEFGYNMVAQRVVGVVGGGVLGDGDREDDVTAEGEVPGGVAEGVEKASGAGEAYDRGFGGVDERVSWSCKVEGVVVGRTRRVVDAELYEAGLVESNGKVDVKAVGPAIGISEGCTPEVLLDLGEGFTDVFSGDVGFVWHGR